MPQSDPASQSGRHGLRVGLLAQREADHGWLAEILGASETHEFEVLEDAPASEVEGHSDRQRPDVAIAFQHGPSIHELSHALRFASGLGSDLPVVVVADLEDEGATMRMLEAGAYGVVTRNEVTTRLLVSVVASAVESQRSIGRLSVVRERERRLATEDPLTSLANRHQFRNRLTASIDAARHSDHSMALLLIDIDDFQLVNDTLGHAVGDELLKVVSRSIRSCTRDTDTVARLGGDEFGIVLTNLNAALDAARIAKKVIDVLSRPFSVAGRTVCSSVSIGISTMSEEADDARALLRQADTAMCHAKKRGRNRAEFFTEEMNATVMRRLALESGMRTAADDGTLLVQYQPIFDIRRLQVVGAEALVRWRHAELGHLTPDEFLPLAEESGLILPIGEAVLRTACVQAAQWQARGHEGFKIAVNVSPRQLQDPGFAFTVDDALRFSGLSAQSLELEITEGSLVEDADLMLRALHGLKELGVGLSVDDFGTGYSALSYLKDLPIDVLKIDRSFVNSLMVDPAVATIVQAIVKMARGLNLVTIAEGVEQQDQLLLLGSYGCNKIQGFLLGRPEYPRQFERWIDDPVFHWQEAMQPVADL
jgi:diguanylate cyclase (GGDEF)-like protein